MTKVVAPKYNVLNTSPIRKGVPEKATGQAKYTADLSLPNMLYGAILHSPLAHARILNIDTTRASQLPGVKIVLTAKDVSHIKFGHSPARFDETTLATTKVRHVGDEVAAVAAVDEQTAKEALELIKVDYEELPAVLDAFEGLADDAPLIHAEYPRNICQEVHNSSVFANKAISASVYFSGKRYLWYSVTLSLPDSR